MFVGAQDKSLKVKDRQYVEKMRPILSFRPYTHQNIDMLFLNYKESNLAPMIYRPATGLNIGGEIAFSFFTFQLPKKRSFIATGATSGYAAKS